MFYLQADVTNIVCIEQTVSMHPAENVHENLSLIFCQKCVKVIVVQGLKLRYSSEITVNLDIF